MSIHTFHVNIHTAKNSEIKKNRKVFTNLQSLLQSKIGYIKIAIYIYGKSVFLFGSTVSKVYRQYFLYAYILRYFDISDFQVKVNNNITFF